MSGNHRGRRNWTHSMTVAVLVAAAAAVVGYMSGDAAGKADRKYLQSTAGSVLFDHGGHNEAVEACVQCHHDLLGSAVATSCDECHDEDVEADDYEHAELKEIHGRQCSQCHEQVKEDDKAVSCRSCHPGIQEESVRTVACSECHEDYTQDMMEHQEYQEVEDHSCVGCHAPASLSEAYHVNCTACHLESSPERFADPKGEVICGACHLR